MFQKIRKALKPKLTFSGATSELHPNSGSLTMRVSGQADNEGPVGKGDTKMTGAYGNNSGSGSRSEQQHHCHHCRSLSVLVVVIFI